MVMAVITVIAVYLGPETNGEDLSTAWSREEQKLVPRGASTAQAPIRP
jgi:hypothetical protein